MQRLLGVVDDQGRPPVATQIRKPTSVGTTIDQKGIRLKEVVNYHLVGSVF